LFFASLRDFAYIDLKVNLIFFLKFIWEVDDSFILTIINEEEDEEGRRRKKKKKEEEEEGRRKKKKEEEVEGRSSNSFEKWQFFYSY
jgi:hypothetical protein